MPVSHRKKRRSGSRSIGNGSRREVDVDAFTAAERKIVDRNRKRRNGRCAAKPPSSPNRCPQLRRRLISATNSCGVPDNLKKLPGVSVAVEKQLSGLGIFHYSQIAAFDEKAAYNIGLEVGLPGRVSGWIDKAKELTAFCPEYKNGIAKLNQRDGLKGRQN